MLLKTGQTQLQQAEIAVGRVGGTRQPAHPLALLVIAGIPRERGQLAVEPRQVGGVQGLGALGQVAQLGRRILARLPQQALAFGDAEPGPVAGFLKFLLGLAEERGRAVPLFLRAARASSAPQGSRWSDNLSRAAERTFSASAVRSWPTSASARRITGPAASGLA